VAPEIEVLSFPAWDCQPYDRVSPNAAIAARRMTVLARLARSRSGEQKPRILTTTVNAILQRLPERKRIAGETFAQQTGVKLQHIPFKGGGEVNSNLLAGNVKFTIDPPGVHVPHVKSGRLKAYAVTGPTRLVSLPDVPTFKELGFDWIDGAYRGIGMPKSTTPEARKRMSDLWAALNNDPEMKELAAKSGFELVNVGVDKMEPFMKDRIRAYTEVAKRMGLTK
jgi:tripartite-type tricarboxylate transporter receptor subunit TctC